MTSSDRGDTSLAPNHFLKVIGIARAVHFDLRRCAIDLLQVIGGELKPRGTEVLS